MTRTRDARSLSVRRGNTLAVTGLPLCLALVLLVADLGAGRIPPHDIPRAAVLALLAGLLEVIVLLSVAPWWSARLAAEHDYGVVVAGLRVVAMTAATSVFLTLVLLFSNPSAFGALAKVQTVVLGVGLLVVGVAGLLREITGRTTLSALATTCVAFVCLATPFWGNFLIRLAGGAKGWTSVFVTHATPLSALADAVGYDLYHGGRLKLYAISIVVDAPYSFPAWWAFALITALTGIVLVAAVTFLRRHVFLKRR